MTGLQWLVHTQCGTRKDNAELATGSWAPKANSCTWHPTEVLLYHRCLKKFMLAMLQRCQNKECVTACCIWGRVAADWVPMLTHVHLIQWACEHQN